MAQSVAAISAVSANLISANRFVERKATGLPKFASFRAVAPISVRRTLAVASMKPTESEQLASALEVLDSESSRSLVASTVAGSLFAVMANAGSAAAAQEVVQLADSDTRGLLLLFVLLPALGWVAFNALKPALNQLDRMKGAKSVVGAVGLGSALTLASAEQADAVQELALIADDTRPLLLLFIILPALGWVLFNIAKPLLNQFNKMTSGTPSSTKRRSVAGALGLGAASLLVAENADAVQEIAQISEDTRPLILVFILVPALGWVAFNIFKPLLNQVEKMTGGGKVAPKKKK